MIENNENAVMHVENLKVSVGRKDILKGINFDLKKNDVLGLIGETGSGKSVLIDALGCNSATGLNLNADAINYNLGDTIINLPDFDREDLQNEIWGKKIAFILSNARSRFNPIIPVGETFVDILMSNFPELTKEQAREKAKEAFRIVQMPDPENNLNSFPQELSGGMVQRVEIAIAFSLNPKFLLMDEPTMGLDVTVQRQILDLMAGLANDMDTTIVIATRDLGIVANYCNKIAVMHNGEIVEFCGVREFFENPQHPYSKYMLKIAFASNDKELSSYDRIITKSDLDLLQGCFCEDACPNCSDICRASKPSMNKYGDSHYVRCHKFAEKEDMK